VNKATTVEDVRTYLNKLGESRVKTETIELTLSMAKISVNMEKSSAASNDVIDAAVLFEAVYQSYLAYATEFERSTGDVPIPMLVHLGELKALALKCMSYVQRGVTARIPVITSTSSIDTVTGFEA
jgi:hypothetical protein